MAQANLKAVITAEDKASSVIGGVGSSFGKLTAAFAAGQLAANAVSKAIQVVSDTVKSSVGAAFEQVRAVENSTIALKAYEKNGDKVNKVLKDLIAYARSDLGVLFQREDLFAAAQTLKLYGQSTDTLVDKVKILSKGVSLGKTSFQELSSIVGRAAAKGRLDAVDFDMLIERGIGLDKSMRGAKVTSEQLFKALDKALPDELLKGRANTIDGAFIRLKSSLRDFGSTILGVDKETSTFIEGGLGDRFLKAVRKFTDFMKSPQITQTVKQFVDNLFQIGNQAVKISEKIGQYLQPKLVALRNSFADILPTLQEFWNNFLQPLAKFFGETLIFAIGLTIDALNLLLKILDPIANWMSQNEGVVRAFAAAFGTLYASIKIWDAIDTMRVGFETLRLVTIPNMQASLSTFIKFATGTGGFALVGAVAVAAAIAIQDAWAKAQNQIDKTNSAIGNLRSSNTIAIAEIKKAMDEGKISVEEGQKRINALERDIRSSRNEASALDQFFNKWGSGDLISVVRDLFKKSSSSGWATGGFTGRGGVNDIAGVVHKGEYVLPQSMVDQSSGTPKSMGGSNINITIQAGAYLGNRQDARKLAELITQAMKDNAKMNGTTAMRMLGA